MHATLIALLIALLWGAADILRKASSGTTTNNQLLSVIFNLGTIISPLLLLAWFLYKKNSLKYSFPHLGLSFIGGFLAGFGGFLLFYLLSKGQAVSSTVPVIRIINIVLVAIGGVMLFSEPVTFKFILGLTLALSGLYVMLI